MTERNGNLIYIIIKAKSSDGKNIPFYTGTPEHKEITDFIHKIYNESMEKILTHINQEVSKYAEMKLPIIIEMGKLTRIDTQGFVISARRLHQQKKYIAGDIDKFRQILNSVEQFFKGEITVQGQKIQLEPTISFSRM